MTNENKSADIENNTTIETKLDRNNLLISVLIGILVIVLILSLLNNKKKKMKYKPPRKYMYPSYKDMY